MRWLGRGVGPYGGWELEHRYVMAGMLGRPMLKTETVHHRNGQRDDNREANLELWVGLGQQPKGARAEDVAVWARELLALYGTEAEQAAYGIPESATAALPSLS